MQRRTFPYLCILLLLFAQHSAWLHASWHAGANTNAQLDHSIGSAPEGAGRQTPGGDESLCAFDLAFGQVLGGTHGTGLAAAFAPAVAERMLDLSAPQWRTAALSPKSRGPPAYS